MVLNTSILSRYKKVFRNITIRTFWTVVSKILSLITLPIIARSLQPEVYGEWNLVRVTLSYVGFFVTFGFISYGIREVSKSNENYKNIVNEIFSARLLIAGVSILISLLVIPLIYGENKFLVFAIIGGFILPIANAINLDFFYFAKENVLIPTLTQIFGQVVYVVLVILLINSPTDLIILSIIFSFSTLITSLMMILHYSRSNQIILKFSFIKSIKLLISMGNIGISTKIEFVQNTIPTVLISLMLGNYMLGIYSAAYKVFGLFIMFFGQLMLILAPYLTKIKKYPIEKAFRIIKTYLLFSFFLGLFIGLILFFFGEWIVLLLFGNTFNDALFLFKLISILMIPVWPPYMILGTILLYTDLDKYLLKCSIISLISLCILSPVLLDLFGLIGIVVSMSISTMIIVVFAAYFIYKFLPPLLPEGINAD